MSYWKRCPALDGRECPICHCDPVKWFSTRDPDYYAKNEKLSRMATEMHARNWQADVDRMALVPKETTR